MNPKLVPTPFYKDGGLLYIEKDYYGALMDHAREVITGTHPEQPVIAISFGGFYQVPDWTC